MLRSRFEPTDDDARVYAVFLSCLTIILLINALPCFQEESGGEW